YLFVGGAAAAVDIAFFFVFAKLAGLNYLVVAPVGFLLATWVNYELSIRHVFRSGARFNRRREILLVYAISAVGLLINQGVLYALVAKLGAGLMAAKFAATATVFFWNYGARSNFVFAPRALPERQSPAEVAERD
ncbi:MAG TPA: GtrA family protein, partial [Casimicrobiaceae bacterium]|nr:GtrA family protein [Casimicrobiaceae bacterium]